MATDRLTQLQACYDQLLTQFFSTVSYLNQRHPLVYPEPVPGDPYTNVPIEDAQDAAATGTPSRHRYATKLKPGGEDATDGRPLLPVTPEKFEEAQRDLAEDLILKGQQIEYLIRSLPGLDKSQEQQATEIEALVGKVHAMEKQKKQKRREMRECVRKLDDVTMGMSTSVDVINGGTPRKENGNANGG